jgi:hypothetical protein
MKFSNFISQGHIFLFSFFYDRSVTTKEGRFGRRNNEPSGTKVIRLGTGG